MFAINLVHLNFEGHKVIFIVKGLVGKKPVSQIFQNLVLCFLGPAFRREEEQTG